MIYGVCRISRRTQNIERQVTNILKEYPTATIIREAYTGTTTNRPEFNKLLKRIKQNDTLVFDSVSRMSRNAEEGIALYFDLYHRNVNLVFLKEPHINTDSYKRAIESAGMQIDCDQSAEGQLIHDISNAITKFMIAKASSDIEKAFEQAQKEVDDLHQRTAEGLREAKAKGKRIGNKKGDTLVTKKSVKAKEIIKKYSRDFNGTLNDIDVMKLAEVSRNTFYKYKKELFLENT